MNPRLPLFLALGLTVPFLTGRCGDDIVIFSGTGNFEPGWKAAPWGGVTVKESPGENGGVAVEGVLSEETKPWCGLSFRSSTEGGQAANLIPLTDELREKGVILLKLNCGKARDNGADGGSGQGVQVAVIFQLKTGTASGAMSIPLQKLNATPSLDGDSETWEEIRVPIRDMQALLPDPSEAEAISSIAVQALGTPSYNLMVGDCRIRLE